MTAARANCRMFCGILRRFTSPGPPANSMFACRLKHCRDSSFCFEGAALDAKLLRFAVAASHGAKASPMLRAVARSRKQSRSDGTSIGNTLN